jgi:hypothetical protein
MESTTSTNFDLFVAWCSGTNVAHVGLWSSFHLYTTSINLKTNWTFNWTWFVPAQVFVESRLWAEPDSSTARSLLAGNSNPHLAPPPPISPLLSLPHQINRPTPAQQPWRRGQLIRRAIGAVLLNSPLAAFCKSPRRLGAAVFTPARVCQDVRAATPRAAEARRLYSATSVSSEEGTVVFCGLNLSRPVWQPQLTSRFCSTVDVFAVQEIVEICIPRYWF